VYVVSEANLPCNNINVSQIGFGCWPLGGHGWGKVVEEDMIHAVHRAIDLGINFFDTAPAYGLGRSEELLGKSLGKKRHSAVIATKFGLTWQTGEVFQKSFNNSPASILREIDGSLKRLDTDYVDLYQIHWPDLSTPIEETLKTLESLIKSGKVLYIGCCNFDANQLKELLQFGRVETMQLRYNLIDRQAETQLIPLCTDNRISVITYSSLADGLLSGKYDAASSFGLDDHRRGDGYFTEQSLSKNLSLVEKVKLVANRTGKTPSQIALRWILENPAIKIALAGIKTTSQLEENAGSLNFRLSREELNFLSADSA
jgi:aryl-alcohol dehydrogenase-like predicted oxidoreductase